MLMRRIWPSRPAFESAFVDPEQLRRELLRLFDGTTAGAPAGSAAAGVFPPMNVTQDAENLYVRAEVPGIKPEEIAISAFRNRLSLTGRREIPAERDKVSYHRRERAEGTFNRTVTLPADVDVDAIEARYASGILTIVVPKAAQAKPRQIAVKS